MYYIYKHYFFIILLVCCIYQGYSQDALLLLKDQNPSYLNPALTGYEDYTRISLVYRNHFPAADKGFVTYSTSFDTYLKNFNSGIGLAIMRDQPGSKAYTYNNAMLSYSYRITIGEGKSIRAGLLGNFYYSSKDPSKLTFPDMVNIDGSTNVNDEPYNKSKAIGLDIAAGVIYNSQRVTIGMAVYHIGNKNDSSYHHRQLKYSAHLEWRIPLYNKQTYANPQKGFQSILKQAYIKPNAYYWQQAYSKILGIGIELYTNNLRLGINSRQDTKFKSMIISTRIGFVAAFMEIDYIFDIGRLGSNLRGLSATSHELGIIFKFGEEKEY
ncbi:MAG: PorP/SprF family type IX secretion system membrane protein [Prevotellaceae bacterium]|nr:PorP/SprF family type IX secretion system membrane protein [Prevotellaceae bacterium]